MKHSVTIGLIVSICTLAEMSAAPFQVFRIGDVDGFGYGAATGLKNDTGGSANGDGDAILDDGDRLPDLNKNGTVATGSSDDFDNRLSESYNGSGFTLSTLRGGSKGLIYTDISLSTSYQNSQPGNHVYNHNTLSYGAGGAFPEASDNLPNQPGFVFDFTVPVGQVNPLASIFFNLRFADYDVSPGDVDLGYVDGTSQSLSLTLQSGNADGLVQSRSLTIPFNKIFQQVGGVYEGYLKVDFDADNEPYTAFDFVEISITDQVGAPVPDSGTTIVSLALGLSSLAVWRRRSAG